MLSCAGAPEADLNLVRSLGQAGVPVIVLGEYARPPSARSRYCRAFVHLPHFSQGSPLRLLGTIRAIAAHLGADPVVFPSADPDAALLATLEQDVGQGLLLTTLPPARLTQSLLDKGRFQALGASLDLPVPRSLRLGEVPRPGHGRTQAGPPSTALTFPLVAKPAWNAAWQSEAVPPGGRAQRAVRLDDPDALAQFTASLPPAALAGTLLQEYVPGDDSEHFGVHAAIDAEGRVLAATVTQNWRIHPLDTGSGSCMVSVDQPGLLAQGLEVLARIGFRNGIADLDFKRHAVTRAFRLLEINPRISHGHPVSTHAGVNLPWLLWRSVCGLPPLAPPAPRFGVRFVNERSDLPSWLAQRRSGRWPWPRYWASVTGPEVSRQWLRSDDPGPLRAYAWQLAQARLRPPANRPAPQHAANAPAELPVEDLRRLRPAIPAEPAA